MWLHPLSNDCLCGGVFSIIHYGVTVAQEVAGHLLLLEVWWYHLWSSLGKIPNPKLLLISSSEFACLLESTQTQKEELVWMGE